MDRLRRDLDLDHDLRLLTIIATIIAQTVNNLLLIDQEKERLQNENLKLKGQLQERYQMGNIIGTSGRMRQVFEMIDRVAKSNATILIRASPGPARNWWPPPFITTASGQQTLHQGQRGGPARDPGGERTFRPRARRLHRALQRKQGRFELAQGGTIFLDEIAT